VGELATRRAHAPEAGDHPIGSVSEAGSTLTTKVYERLRDDIILGVWRPGQKLTLDVLKDKYALGVTPLREALYRLSASLLVTLEDRRGFRVAPVSPGHLAEVIQLREEAEATLLRSAFKHGDVNWETRIVAAYHALMRAGEYRPNPGPYTVEWESAHREFHHALLSAARLPMLEEFHRSLWDHAARYRNLAYPGRMVATEVFDGHQQLMDAVMARDEELAIVLLRRHIRLATSHIISAMFPGAT
jgi:GntR family transcriptional regulator, carbon starvation induced regulator